MQIVLPSANVCWNVQSSDLSCPYQQVIPEVLPRWENGLHVPYFWPPKENGQGKDIRKLLSPRMINGRFFFLLAAAWVDPGRSALQSAEQWCKGRYGRIHQVGKMSFYDKNMQKGRLKQHTNKKEKVKQETIHVKCQDCRRGLR